MLFSLYRPICPSLSFIIKFGVDTGSTYHKIIMWLGTCLRCGAKASTIINIPGKIWKLYTDGRRPNHNNVRATIRYCCYYSTEYTKRAPHTVVRTRAPEGNDGSTRFIPFTRSRIGRLLFDLYVVFFSNFFLLPFLKCVSRRQNRYLYNIMCLIILCTVIIIIITLYVHII